MRTYLPPDQLAPLPTAAIESEPTRVNWWLRLTSSGWDRQQRSRVAQDLARRSVLTSYIAAVMLVALLLLLVIGLGDPPTMTAVVVGFGIVLAAIFLNRAGLVAFAGSLQVVLIMGAVFGVMLSAPGGLDTVYLPAYDLLALAVVIAASVLSPGAAFVVALLNVALIVADFFLQHHTGDLVKQIQLQGGGVVGEISMIARPIALNLVIAVVAYLWTRGVRTQILRADRAEEMALLEHQIVEQKRQVDYGIQQILQTHIRAANGDFSARAPLGQDNVLWQISSSLNNLLQRLQRSGQAEYEITRARDEAGRLAQALLDARQGRRPMWPMPSGTVIDPIIEALGVHARQQQLPPSPSSGYGGTSGTGWGGPPSRSGNPYS
jgi:hypothetical protein